MPRRNKALTGSFISTVWGFFIGLKKFLSERVTKFSNLRIRIRKKKLNKSKGDENDKTKQTAIKIHTAQTRDCGQFILTKEEWKQKERKRRNGRLFYQNASPTYDFPLVAERMIVSSKLCK